MDNSNSKNKHLASNILFAVGAVMMFIGFVFPGWLWLLNTPGDMEMLPLAAITIAGVLGLIMIIGAFVKRRLEKKLSKAS